MATKKTLATKARIVDAATQLFNEQGTHAITTHDIAGAVGISPGNLYYHFKNKEEIIAAALAEAPLLSPEGWRQAIAGQDTESFYSFLDFFFSGLRRYRFFFREQADLTRSSPELAAMWKKAHAGLLSVMREATAHWICLGILVGFATEEDRDAFIHNSWIVMSFSHSYFEGIGETKPKKLQTAISRQLAAFLRPYHTKKGKELLDLYFAKDQFA